MSIEIYKLIGETTAYDKKQMLEIKRPKSWLKSEVHPKYWTD